VRFAVCQLHKANAKDGRDIKEANGGGHGPAAEDRATTGNSALQIHL